MRKFVQCAWKMAEPSRERSLGGLNPALDAAARYFDDVAPIEFNVGAALVEGPLLAVAFHETARIQDRQVPGAPPPPSFQCGRSARRALHHSLNAPPRAARRARGVDDSRENLISRSMSRCASVSFRAPR